MAIETRACRDEELGALVSLANRVFMSDGQGEMGAMFPLLFCRENLEGLRVVAGPEGPVAHVGMVVRDAVLLGARIRVACIGAVCTDPGHRGRGFASALMADARRQARESGASLMLISGGRGLYHRLGYVNVGRFDRYQLGAGELHGAGNPGITLTEYREEDLPALAALHQTEPVRFLRSATDWRQLMQAGHLMCAPTDLLGIRQDGHLVAYVGVQRPRAADTRRSDASAGMARIRELAGSRSALVDALPALLERYGGPAVDLQVQPSDVELTVQARRRGWTARTEAFTGTLGVIDPPVMMDALGPVLAERDEAAAQLRLNADQNGATFELGTEQYHVAAPGPLAALLFGGTTDEAQALPPRTGALGELLDALFPLPLLYYGYNYV
jgi:GNAT superfamily N-acetyltransferase